VVGREDSTFPVAEGRRPADAVPGAELTVLEGAGHLAALEVPERVTALVREFLGRHPY
jgi:3-oxoadipate enol-lactonase